MHRPATTAERAPGAAPAARAAATASAGSASSATKKSRSSKARPGSSVSANSAAPSEAGPELVEQPGAAEDRRGGGDRSAAGGEAPGRDHEFGVDAQRPGQRDRRQIEEDRRRRVGLDEIDIRGCAVEPFLADRDHPRDVGDRAEARLRDDRRGERGQRQGQRRGGDAPRPPRRQRRARRSPRERARRRADGRNA